VNGRDRESLADLVERFLDENLAQSPAFRSLAKCLAELTLERIREHEAEHEARATSQDENEKVDTPGLANGIPSARAKVEPTAVVPLRIGDARIEVPVSGESRAVTAARDAAQLDAPRHDHEDDYLKQTAEARAIDLGRISKRCRLKADSCLHQVLRQNQERESAEEYKSRQRMNELIATARSIPDCFLWMFFRKGAPSTDAQLRLIAGCYEAMADAIELCHAIEPLDEWVDQDQVRTALQLLATTSSGLRVALANTWLTQADIDQDEVHRWLKLVTAEHRYLVKHHMQLSDPADPEADVADAHERARELHRTIEADRSRSEAAERLLKRGLYHAQRVRDASKSPYDEEPPTHDCQKINEVVEGLVDLAPPDLDANIRQIAGVVGPSMFSHVVEPHDRLADAASRLDQERNKPRPDRESTSQPAERTWSDSVLEVREMLAGSQIVVIGGEPRRDAIDRMRDAFGLDAVSWPELTEHGSAEPMRAPISSPQTRLVVVLIKLTGHEHAERARDFARQASVPSVLMPAGYNPEMIAAEVLRQASAQLGSA
jgi:hypothetical protein